MEGLQLPELGASLRIPPSGPMESLAHPIKRSIWGDTWVSLEPSLESFRRALAIRLHFPLRFSLR